MDKVKTRIDELLKHVRTLDGDQVVVMYDGDSDILMIHFYGRSIAATNLAITDELMIRYDRSSDRVVGVQIDHFLSIAVREYPHLINLMDIAELREFDTERYFRARRDIAEQHRTEFLNESLLSVGDVNIVAD